MVEAKGNWRQGRRRAVQARIGSEPNSLIVRSINGAEVKIVGRKAAGSSQSANRDRYESRNEPDLYVNLDFYARSARLFTRICEQECRLPLPGQVT